MTILLLESFVDQATGLAWMDRSDVDTLIGAKQVDKLCSDDSGSGRANVDILNTLLAKAEQKVVSILLRGFTVEEIVDIMKKDQICRSFCADIASEYMSRRKGDFTSQDGKGRYYQSFKEACEHFEKMSHGRTLTSAEANRTNAQQGGRIRPPLPLSSDGTPTQPFIFAPNTGFRGPGGRGGF